MPDKTNSVVPMRQHTPPGKQDSETPGGRACTLAVSSGKGGVGKSSIALNLGLELCRLGHRTCLLDADTNLANVNILLGLSPDNTLQELLRGDRTLDEILLQGPEGLQIVPAASGITDFIHLSADQQQRLLASLQELEQRFDYLIIDTAAGIHQPLIQLLLAASDLLVVITPEPTSLTDAFSLLKVLKHFCFERPVQVVVNMADSRTAAHDSFKRFHAAVGRFLQLDTHYLGYVLRDRQFAKSVMQQRPILLSHPDAVASRCLRSIGNRLQQRFHQTMPGSLSSFFRQSQLTGAELDRIRPFTEQEEQEEQEEQVETAASNDGGMLSATYYASLFAAVEQGGKG